MGTIANKLTYLNDTTEQFKQNVNNTLVANGYPVMHGRSTLRDYAHEIGALGLQKNLFGTGEQGVMYIPKPKVFGQQVLFQDAAGTTPVTSDGDPVGLMLDLSGNGNHATQTTSAARPVYRTDGQLHWLEFDGVDDSIASSLYTRPQPHFTSICMLPDTINRKKYIDSARKNNESSLYSYSNGDLRVYAGVTGFIHPSKIVAGNKTVVSYVTNGPSTRFYKNKIDHTGDAGAMDSAGVIIGLGGGGTVNSSEHMQGRVYGVVAINENLAVDKVGYTDNYLASLASIKFWTPKELFTTGEQGVWYEPKPQYLWQDAAGTVPVMEDGDPVGLMLDLSGNGNHATQPTSAARPVYRTDGVLHWLEGDGVDDVLVVSGSKTVLSFLTDGTGATMQLIFDKVWRDGESDVLAGTAFYSSASSGLDLFVDRRSGRVYRYRHVNPADNLEDSLLLDYGADVNQPTIFEYRQDASWQTWSTSTGVSESTGLGTELAKNDLRIFGVPASAGETTNSLISPGVLTFYGGIIINKRIDDLTNSRNYLATLAGVQL